MAARGIERPQEMGDHRGDRKGAGLPPMAVAGAVWGRSRGRTLGVGGAAASLGWPWVLGEAFPVSELGHRCVMSAAITCG
jgi:hypothetical protein